MKELTFKDPFRVERIRRNFTQHNGMIMPAYEVRRISYRGHRYAFTVSDRGAFGEAQIGATSITKYMPRDPGLDNWMIGMGSKSAANELMRLGGFIGTFQHHMIDRYLKAAMVCEPSMCRMYIKDIKAAFLQHAKEEEEIWKE